MGSYVLNPFVGVAMCAYGGDGATRGKICQPPGRSASCVPACMPNVDEATGDSQHAYDAWCDGTGDYFCASRPWRPRDIGIMLDKDREATGRSESRDEHHAYNEIVLDGLAHNAALPSSIEAFLVGSNDDLAKTLTLHARFLAEYGLTATDVPLLRYRPENEPHGGAVFASL